MLTLLLLREARLLYVLYSKVGSGEMPIFASTGYQSSFTIEDSICNRRECHGPFWYDGKHSRLVCFIVNASHESKFPCLDAA
jgi:hypothetical protein